MTTVQGSEAPVPAINYDALSQSVAALSPSQQAEIAKQIALMTAKAPEVASAVQAAIEGLQASPAPASPAAERLAELLKQPEPEVSASTQIAEAQMIARDAAAKGENVSAISQKVGAEVGGQAFAQNMAQTAVQEQQQTQQLANQNSSKAMHEETVAKAEGREAPAANPFAAALAASGFKASDVVASSMLQYHNAEASSVVGAGKQRSAEGHQIA